MCVHDSYWQCACTWSFLEFFVQIVISGVLMWINYLVQNFSEVENVAAKEKKLHEPIYITKQLDRI